MYLTYCRKSKLNSLDIFFRPTSYSSSIITKTWRHASFLSRHFSDSTAVSTNKPSKDVSGNLPRHYESDKVESEWYQWWEKEAFFQVSLHSKDAPSRKSYTMILPPPNITGTLHLGHALTVTVQDVLSRWRRMSGHHVVWIPGTDHAGIATQVVVEKQLWAKAKATRHDFGRDRFVNEIWKWQEEKGSHIQNQLRLMGASLDWTREYFTMDEKQSQSVVEAFVRLFDEGLIYRSDIPVNWSCWLQSTISDVEVESLDIDGPTAIQIPGYDKPVQFGILTNLVYKSCKDDCDIVVSTTRPETMLGDVAIAVHPADNRYTHLHGSEFWHPYRKQKIPLICDDFVDQNFGTGAVKITPAHDRNDFEVAKRHKLPLISVINGHGKIHEEFEVFKGLKRFDARESIVKDLALQGLLQGEVPHKMSIPMCSRSGDVVELIPKSQWFLSTGDMAKKAIKAVKDGNLWLTPEQSEQDWIRWFENHQDWCLSRQLWWGHRIPLYKCYILDESSHKWIAARTEAEAKHKASSHFSCQPNDPRLVVQQDEDVLDTWFSSSLLPFSALGWPSKTTDLKKHYPLSLMVTGNDILLFWVARMVILGEHLTGICPFSDVFLHGVIRDGSGRKMSKSIGNVVSPEDIRDGRSLKELVDRLVLSSKAGVIPEKELKNAIRNQKHMFPNGIPKCGTDALRFTLCSYQIDRHFIDFNVLDCDGARRFCNKIWQACRYVEGVMEHSSIPAPLQPGDFQSLTVMDLWILSKLSNLIAKIDEDLSKFNLNACVHGLRNFIHHEFCDVYVESTKFLKTEGDTEAKKLTRSVLATCVQNSLLLLAPFMPFLTEELYHRIPYIQDKCKSISLHPYPQLKDWLLWQNASLEREIDIILQTSSAIKKLKNYNGLKIMDRVQVTLLSKSEEELQHFLKHRCLLETFSFSRVINVMKSSDIVSNDFMTEEKINDSSLIKIIFENENDKELSETHRQGIVTAAFLKHLKLQDQILKIKKRIESQKFSLKDDDFRQGLLEKLANLEEESIKVNIFLDQAPNLRDKIREEISQKKTSKSQEK